MKISKKQRENLYSIIFDNITDLRIKIGKEHYLSDLQEEKIDSKLFDLDRKIWNDIRTKIFNE